MASELEICAAAFFRIQGKDVVVEEEFRMSIALNYKWMSVKEADQLMKTLLGSGIIVKSNGYLKPAKDLSAIPVPIAYRPSEELRKQLSGTVKVAAPSKTSAAPKDLFVEMLDIAVDHGIPRGKFVSESNILKKKLGVETVVAAIIILRDNGIDTKELEERAYAQILLK
ncbi:MAG: DUF2240 family protein [archaeon]|nr:DUF2240 family protein [archaeon]